MQGAEVKPAVEGTIKAILATPRPTGDEARLYSWFFCFDRCRAAFVIETKLIMQGADTKPMEEGIIKASLATPRNFCADGQVIHNFLLLKLKGA